MILEQIGLTPAAAVEMFIRLRDTKKAKDDEHKKSMEKLVASMEKLEAGLLEHLNTHGVNSVACDAGTVYKSTQLSATVADKEAFKQWVAENENWDAVDLKANKTFVKDYMEAHQEAPPGIKATTMSTVGVQRK